MKFRQKIYKKFERTAQTLECTNARGWFSIEHFWKRIHKTKSKFDILGLKLVIIEPILKTEIFELIVRVKFWIKKQCECLVNSQNQLMKQKYMTLNNQCSTFWSTFIIREKSYSNRINSGVQITAIKKYF